MYITQQLTDYTFLEHLSDVTSLSHVAHQIKENAAILLFMSAAAFTRQLCIVRSSRTKSDIKLCKNNKVSRAELANKNNVQKNTINSKSTSNSGGVVADNVDHAIIDD